MLAAGAEVLEGEVRGAGELDADGEDGGVEIEDGAELDLYAELDGGGGEGLAVEDPAAAVGEGEGELGQDGGALFVAEALDVDGLQWGRRSGNSLETAWDGLVLRVFIGAAMRGHDECGGLGRTVVT